MDPEAQKDESEVTSQKSWKIVRTIRGIYDYWQKPAPNLTKDPETQKDENEVTSQAWLYTIGPKIGTAACVRAIDDRGMSDVYNNFDLKPASLWCDTDDTIKAEKRFWETVFNRKDGHNGTGIYAGTVKNSFDDHDAWVVYNMRDGHDGNALHWIARYESFYDFKHLVEKLGRINKPFNLVNVGDKDGRTPLISAVLGGKEFNVAFLCSLFAQEILPNIEDKWGKTALDYAQESKQGNIVMELMKMKDVQYSEEQRLRQMQSVADKMHLVGGLYCTALGTAVFASEVLFGASNVSTTSAVSVSCSVCGAIAAFMSVAAPSDNVKAKIRYLQRLLAISCIMLLIAILALMADLFLVGNTPPFMKALGVSSIAITILACILARMGVI